jgi:hypothetical protein
MATKMTMTGFHVATVAAGVLLAVSEPSLAAKRVHNTKSAVNSQARASGSAIRPYGDAARPYGRETHPFGPDYDPYAPGVNWPKAD